MISLQAINHKIDKPPSILIIDDSSDFRRLLHHYLAKKYPNAVIEELDGLNSNITMHKVLHAKYNIILLDYLLDYTPGERNGLDILSELRQLKCNSSIILMTAHGDELLAVKAIRNGAFDYIVKQNFKKEDFLNSISEALSHQLELQPPQTTNKTIDVTASAEFGHHMLVQGYRPLYRLGAGGQALTYLAESFKDGPKVVLKLLPSNTSDTQVLGRFVQEYEMISKLEHRNIVQLHSQGISDNTVFIVMEHLRNGSLREKMSRRKIQPHEAISIVRQLSQALSHMHEHGVLHRDIKPTNIMFRDANTPVLIDFGAAKQMLSHSDLTLHGEVLGTPHYMSPEQALSEPLSPATDIYSLGIVFHEMLTGQLPYRGDRIAAIIAQHRLSPLPILPKNLRHFQPILNRMLAKKALLRYHSAQDLNDALATIN